MEVKVPGGTCLETGFIQCYESTVIHSKLRKALNMRFHAMVNVPEKGGLLIPTASTRSIKKLKRGQLVLVKILKNVNRVQCQRTVYLG